MSANRATTAALAALTAVYLVLAGTLWFSADRTWVDLRYARNLARGLGPVFNPGDPPLEAWDSPLTVALATLLESAGIAPLLVLQLGGAVAGAAVLWVLFGVLTERLGIGETVAIGAIGTLALSPMLAAWASGMPGVLPGVLALLVAFDRLVYAPRPGWSAAVALGLLIAIRHDGPAWALGLIVIAAVHRGLEHRRLSTPLPRAARPSTWSFAGPLFAIAVGIVGVSIGIAATRLAVFGHPVPWALRRLGTHPLAGLNYALATALGVGLPLWWFGALAFPGGRDRTALPAVLALGLGLIGVIASGGETDPFGRLVLPLAPFGTMVLARLAQQQVSVSRGGTAFWLLAFAAIFGHLPAWDLPLAPRMLRQATDLRPDKARTRTEVAHWRFMRDQAHSGRALGHSVAGAVGPDASWVTAFPGVRGYASDLHIYDQTGWTDPAAWRIAERGRSTRDHFLELEPTVLRARRIQDKPVAMVLAEEWGTDHPDYAARTLKQPDGSWLVLQERVLP